jgi:hypothetical protein
MLTPPMTSCPVKPARVTDLIFARSEHGQGPDQVLALRRAPKAEKLSPTNEAPLLSVISEMLS